jgi:predicted membrane protein (TIGR00267 family)
MAREQIFLTGMVLIFVEAFSMAAGSFLAESSADEYETHSERTTTRSRVASLIMFVSYFISGFVPLAPYLLLPASVALWISISLSLLALAILGIVGARISKVGMTKNAFRMVVVGGLAICAGVTVGLFVQNS